MKAYFCWAVILNSVHKVWFESIDAFVCTKDCYSHALFDIDGNCVWLETH